MLLADAVELFLRVAQVALRLRLGTVKNQQHGRLRGEPAEAGGEGVAVALPLVKFRVPMHFLREGV